MDVLKFINVLPDDGRLLDTPASVIAGLTYNFLPFMILPIYASLEGIDKRLIEASKDLYANARDSFLRVTLPLSMPGVIAGTLLTFIPAVGDYINADFLGGPSQAMIGNVIQSQYLVIKDYPVAAALSFVLMALILIVVLIYIRFAGSEALMGDEAEESSRGEDHEVAAPQRDRHLWRPGDRLHADPDRRHRRLLVQRPDGQVQLHLAGLHLRALEERVRDRGAERGPHQLAAARRAFDDRRDPAGNADRPCAGSLPVPRAQGDQPPDRDPDGDA